MSKNISIFINVRKLSRRCTNKLLRPFAGTSLIEILLEKLRNLYKYPIYFAAYEAEFIAKVRDLRNINVIKRSKESAEEHSDAFKIFEPLNHIPSDYVAWINPSHPFLNLDTFLFAIELFENKKAASLTSVQKKKGWFYTPQGQPINNKEKLEVDTSLSEWIYEAAHAFHIYKGEFMITNGRPWTNTIDDPYLFEIPKLEALDIDTEEDFYMIEYLYRKLKLEEKIR